MKNPRSIELNRSNILSAIAIIITIIITSVGASSYLIEDGTSTGTKVASIEKRIDRLEVEVNLKIDRFEKSITKELGYLKTSIDQNTKTSNILQVSVGKNTYAANRIQRIVEKLNDTMSDLNITLGRLDERMKGVEKK